MTLLPEIEEQPQVRHNWLYSVLPVYGQLYLSGYCRACDTAFSKIIPHSIELDYDIVVTKMDIPKFGCLQYTGTSEGLGAIFTGGKTPLPPPERD